VYDVIAGHDWTLPEARVFATAGGRADAAAAIPPS
jgi:hypothetical protein